MRARLTALLVRLIRRYLPETFAPEKRDCKALELYIVKDARKWFNHRLELLSMKKQRDLLADKLREIGPPPRIEHSWRQPLLKRERK
jgi:hypothetical protein